MDQLVQSKKGSRGTIVKFPVRQLLFSQSRRCCFFCNNGVSFGKKVDEEYIEELRAKGENENTKNSKKW